MPPQSMSYTQIAEDLAKRIELGEYAPHAKLPSYTELADLYGVSVSTAQRAYVITNTKGITYGLVGRGVFVAGQK